MQLSVSPVLTFGQLPPGPVMCPPPPPPDYCRCVLGTQGLRTPLLTVSFSRSSNSSSSILRFSCVFLSFSLSISLHCSSSSSIYNRHRGPMRGGSFTRT